MGSVRRINRSRATRSPLHFPTTAAVIGAIRTVSPWPGQSRAAGRDHKHARKDFELASRAEHLARAHLLVSYRVSTTPPGNVRVSTRFRFTQLSSAVKNGVPPPTSTG
jgi:hypothetical protein